jgi:RHS repeat-associated protein
MNRCVNFRGCAILAALTVLAAPIDARASDDELVTIHFLGSGDTYEDDGFPLYGTLTLSIYESQTSANPSVSRYRESTATLAGYLETPWTAARLELGRRYTLTVSASDVVEQSIQLVTMAPPEFSIELLDGPGGTGPYYGPLPPGCYQLIVRRQGSLNRPAEPVGAADRLIDAHLSWSVSLGSLLNGTGAGTLGLADCSFESSWDSAFRPSGLKYDTALTVIPTPSGVSSPFIAGAPRQILAPEALVDIYPVTSTEFELRFYDPKSPDDLSVVGTLYDVSDRNPFLVFNIRKPGASSTELQLTRSTFDIASASPTTAVLVETASIARAGSTWYDWDWTVRDWNESGDNFDQGAAQLVENYDNYSYGAYSSVDDYWFSSAYSLRRPNTNPLKEANAGGKKVVKKAWGEVPTEERTGSVGDGLTTYYTYYENDADLNAYSRLHKVTRPDGSWEGYEYFGEGATGFPYGGFKLHRPFLSSPASPPSTLAGDYNGTVTAYRFASSYGVRSLRLASVETTVNSSTTVVSKTEFSYYSSATFMANNVALVRATRSDWTENNQSTALKTVTRYYNVANNGLYGDQVFSIERPDKTKTVFVYQKGTLSGESFSVGGTAFGTSTDQWSRIVAVHGTTDSTGATAASTYDNTSYSLVSANDSQTDAFYLVANRSTADITIRDPRARVVRTETRVWNGSGWVLVASQTFTHDQQGYVIGASGSNGAVTSAAYLGEYKTSETDVSGHTTTFFYDDAGRVRLVTRQAATEGENLHVPELQTSFTYDAAGRMVSRSRGASQAVIETWDYDLAGRLALHQVPGQPDGETPTWVDTEYDYSNGGRDVTVTNNDNKAVTTARFLDGRTQSITGDATVPRYFAYAVDSSGRLVVREQMQAGADPDDAYGAGWRKTVKDWIGRAVLALGPTTDSGWHTGTKLGWNTVTGSLDWSKPIKQTSAGGSQTQVGGYTRYEYDSMGALKRTGLDVESTTDMATLEPDSGDRIVDYTYGLEVRSNYWWFARRTYAYPFTGTTSLLVDESFSRIQFPSQSGTITIEESESKDRFENLTNSKTVVNRTEKWLQTITNTPDSTSDVVVEYRAGVPVKRISAQGVTTLIAHDSWGRLLQERQAEEWPFPEEPGKAPDWQDEDDHAQLLVHFSYYNGTDLVEATGNWANKSYKTSRFVYDNLNRVQANIHEIGPDAATTSYYCYDGRGFLTHQWGTASHPVRYEYDDYGRRTKLHTYRGNGAWTGSTFPSTDFGYAGEETTWTFDGPTGLVTGKTDAKNKTVNYTYNDRNQLHTRQWARPVGGNGAHANERVTTTYGYYNSGSNLTGELATVTYNDDGTTADLSYGYCRDGQLDSVTDATGQRAFEYTSSRQRSGEALPSSFFGSRKIAHGYFDGTYDSTKGYLEKTAFGPASNPWAGPGNGNIVQTNYEFDWDKARVSSASRRYDSATEQSFSYAYETNGYRVASVTSGTTYMLEYQLQAWRNLVDSVKTYGNNGGALQLKADYRNNYDWMERRTDETTYTSPGLLGIATPASREWGYNTRGEVTSETVKYNGTTQPAQGRSYTWDNGWNRDTVGTGGNTTTYTISAGNEIDSTSGYEAANYTYDDDGNLTDDGTLTYRYDAENRLKQAVNAGVTLSYTYTYDYIGRRVRRAKYVAPGSVTTTTFVFDGWNLIAELDGSLNPTRTYTWGPDGTGAIRGGGTGGLLMISQGTGGTTRWFPVYDSRHNITGLLDQDGTTVAAYTYDSFGRVTLSGGAQAGNNPFGFATQYTESDIGLVYFGHRFYSPLLGRFINRDPIAEAGGLNLYAYCRNDPVNCVEVLGLGDDRPRWGIAFGFGYDDWGTWGDYWWWAWYYAYQEWRRNETIVRGAESRAAWEANRAIEAGLRSNFYKPSDIVWNAFGTTGSSDGANCQAAQTAATGNRNWSLDDLLREIANSPEAMRLMRRLRVQIRVVAGDTTQEARGWIAISENLTLERAVVAVFHELGHKNDRVRDRVQPSDKRRYPNVESYIAARAETEVKAHTSEDQLIKDYEANGGKLPLQHDPRFYDPATGTTRADEIRRAIISGELVASTGKTYREMYIEEWEQYRGAVPDTPAPPDPAPPPPASGATRSAPTRPRPRLRVGGRRDKHWRCSAPRVASFVMRIWLCVLVCAALPSAYSRDRLRDAVVRESGSDYAFFLENAPDYRISSEADNPFRSWTVHRCMVLGTSHSPIEFYFAFKADKAVILTSNLAGLNQVISDERMTFDLRDQVVVRFVRLIRPTDHRFWILGVDRLKADQIAVDAIAAAGYSLPQLIETSGRLVQPDVRRFFVIERAVLKASDVSLSSGRLSIREEVLVKDVVVPAD